MSEFWLWFLKNLSYNINMILLLILQFILDESMIYIYKTDYYWD